MQFLSNFGISLFLAHKSLIHFFCFVEICSSVTETHVDISSVMMKMGVAGCLETSVLPHYKTQHKHLEGRH